MRTHNYIEEEEDIFRFFFNFNNKKCESKLVELNITLEDAYNGGRKEVEYDRIIICPKCKGTGSKNPNAITTCEQCKGSKVKWTIQNQEIKTVRIMTNCDECNGEGRIIKEKCEECKGKMVKKIRRIIGINIEKGVPDGHKYKLRNEGDEYPGKETGDLIIKIFLKKHKDFIRKEADLLYKCEISSLQALTGVKLIINHLNGRKILIHSKPGNIIQPQTLKTVKELGMPFFNSPQRYGNLYIDFHIVFPDTLTEQQNKKLLEDEKTNIVGNLSEDIEKFNLEDYNESETDPSYRGWKKEDWKEENGDKDKEEEEEKEDRTINCSNQ